MIQVTRCHLRPYLTSCNQNFSPPLQPMLSNTTFFLSNTFLLSQFSPPSAAHAFNDTRYQGSSAIVPDFLLSKFCPPSAGHAFNYNIPFIKNIPFITIFPPSAAHAFNDTRYQGSFATLPDFLLSKLFPPLCSPCFQLHSFYQKHSFYQNFSPPSAAHAFNYIPFIKNITFIKIFPPLCSPCFQLHSFYQNFSPPSAAHAFNDTRYQGSSAIVLDFTCDSSKAVGRVRRPRDYCTCHTKRT